MKLFQKQMWWARPLLATFIAVVFFAGLPSVRAIADTTVNSKLLLGPNGYDETLSGDGSFGLENWTWSVIAEAALTSTTDNFGNPLLEHTDNFTLEIDSEVSKKLEVGLEYQYSLIPEESLVNNGPELNFTDTINLNKTSDDDIEIFSPTLKLKVGGKYFRYLQSFNGNFPSNSKVVYPLVGYNALRQISAEFFATLDLLKALSIQLNFTYTFYDRNVAEFLQYLDSEVAATMGASGFGSSVSGFPMATDGATITVRPLKDWSFDLEIVDNVQVVDLSNAWTYDLTIFREVGDWKLGSGYEYENSATLTTYYYIISAELTF